MAVDYPDGTLAINIVASAITLTVEVTGTANINITAQNVGLYVERDWATKQDYDHSGTGSQHVTSSGTYYFVTETVAAGKVIYIDAVTFSGAAGSYSIHVFLRIAGITMWQADLVNCVAEHIFSTPHKATAGQQIQLGFIHYADVTCYASGTYEGRQYS